MSIALAVLAFAYTLYFAKAVLLPIVFAGIVALILRPMVRKLVRVGCHPMLAALIVVGGLVGLVVWCGFLIFEPTREWITSAPDRFEEAKDKIASFRDSVSGLAEAKNELEEITSTPGDTRPIPVEVKQPTLNSSVIGPIGQFFASAAISTVLAFFLLARFDALVDAILGFLKYEVRRDRIREGIVRVELGVSRYLFTVTVINAVQGIVIAIALYLLGLPNPIFWGVVATVLNYVPFIGAWTGTAMVGVASLLTFETLPAIIAPPIAFMSLTSIEGSFITPLILGHSMKLDPFIVFLSLVVFGWMWGVMGAILAVPMLAIAKTICEEFSDWRPVALLIGGESPPERADRLTP